VLAANRLWREANRARERARIREYSRRWRREHPERARLIDRLATARRRARLRDALVVPFTRERLDARLAYFGERCWVCGGPFQEVDHVIAIARGGPHCLANLRPICRSCNARKGARDWREWVAQAS
jgi:5-methylcytosine-specific restriction endonuclease McrA